MLAENFIERKRELKNVNTESVGHDNSDAIRTHGKHSSQEIQIRNIQNRNGVIRPDRPELIEKLWRDRI